MHTCSPMDCAPSPSFNFPRAPHSRTAGFSLVEVTTAIGIVAFAFIALIGLLPSGLQVFRESIDSANEMWIMQNLNSMVQVTSWSKIEDLENVTFYFDEEGRLTDRVSPEEGGETSQEVKDRRIYAVKLLVSKPSRPGDPGSPAGSTAMNAYSENVVRVIAVIAPYLKPNAMTEFEGITEVDDLKRTIGKGSALKTRAFLVSRMDSMREDASS